VDRTFVEREVVLYKQIFLFYFYNVGNYCREEQDTDDNMAHAHCILVTEICCVRLKITYHYHILYIHGIYIYTMYIQYMTVG
jgi:hypothetical protein